MPSITEARQMLTANTFNPTLQELVRDLFFKEQAGIVALQAFDAVETTISNLNDMNAKLLAAGKEKDERIAQLLAKLDAQKTDQVAASMVKSTAVTVEPAPPVSPERTKAANGTRPA